MRQSLSAQDRAAASRPCIRCGRSGSTRNSHYNGFRAHRLGKGTGQKGSRVAMAEFCFECDQLFSEEAYGLWEGGSKSIERSEEFLFWVVMTRIRREEQNNG